VTWLARRLGAMSLARGLERSCDHRHSYVLANRYVFAYFDGLNRVYVREEETALTKRFQLPPGVFDDIMYGEPDKIQELSGLLKRSEAGGTPGIPENGHALRAPRAREWER
jgi:hypothetical protein